jgi:hypothetical protein
VLVVLRDFVGLVYVKPAPKRSPPYQENVNYRRLGQEPENYKNRDDGEEENQKHVKAKARQQSTGCGCGKISFGNEFGLRDERQKGRWGVVVENENWKHEKWGWF